MPDLRRLVVTLGRIFLRGGLESVGCGWEAELDGAWGLTDASLYEEDVCIWLDPKPWRTRLFRRRWKVWNGPVDKTAGILSILLHDCIHAKLRIVCCWRCHCGGNACESA